RSAFSLRASSALPFCSGSNCCYFSLARGTLSGRSQLHRQIRSRIAEVAGLSLGPLIEPGGVHNNLAVWRQLHVRAIHGARRGPFKVDPFAVVAAAVAGALELVFAGFPVGRAAEVRAARVDDKDAIGCAVHPDTIFLLPLGIHAEGVVRGVANFENSWRFEKSTRKKETQEGNEPCAKKSRDSNPHQPPPLPVDFTGLGTDGCQTAGGRCFGCTDGRRTNILGSIAATGRGCLRRFRFWFGRISFRARHALPPGFVVLENNLAATESAARSPFRLWACRKLRNVREKISIFRRRMETTVHRTHKFFRMDWKNYRKRVQSLKASEARRIGKV